jgi:hypothetical protein
MGQHSILARLGDDARAARDAWEDSTLLVAEHLLDCRSGCDDLIVRCPDGMLVAEQERAAWRTWGAARKAEQVAVASVEAPPPGRQIVKLSVDLRGRQWYRVDCWGCNSAHIEAPDRMMLEGPKFCIACAAPREEAEVPA